MNRAIDPSKQASKQATAKASKQASKQASNGNTSKQASKQATAKQPTEFWPRGKTHRILAKGKNPQSKFKIKNSNFKTFLNIFEQFDDL